MKKSIFILLIFLSACTMNTVSPVRTGGDRFSGISHTRIQLGFTGNEQSNIYFWKFEKQGKVDYAMQYEGFLPEWKFLDSGIGLVDGKRWQLPEPSKDRKVHQGYVTEKLTFYIPRGDIEKIAKSRVFEVQFSGKRGAAELKFSPEQLQGVKKFLDKTK